MGNIKDLIDLAKDLESRVKDRKDIDTLRAIVSLTHSVQAQNTEVVERDIRTMQENANLVSENAQLKKQLSEAQSEDICIHRMVEFRRGKRTGGMWQPFCPKCHMPAGIPQMGVRVECSAGCGWKSAIGANDFKSVFSELP